MATNSFILGVLAGLGAPSSASNVQALEAWFAAEGGTNNNPLNTKESGFGGKVNPNNGVMEYPSESDGVAATVATLRQQNMAGIANALRQGLDPAQIQAAVIASPWDEGHYSGTAYGEGPVGPGETLNTATGTASGGPAQATLTADVTPASTVPVPGAPGEPSLANIGTTGDADVVNTGGPGSATLPAVVFQAPEKGVNVQHFGASASNPEGFDLSAIPKNMLGNAEAAIKQYIDNPNYAAQLNQTITEDYAYQGWVQKIPELNGIVIWAAADLDPATAAGENIFLSAVQNTQWYQTTTQNQRAWQQAQSQDPATAANALRNAQEQVLSTANQIGVTLTKAQLSSIANMYASNYYTPTGILGTEAGTSQGWLDQAVIDAVTTIQKTGTMPAETIAGANAMATPGAAAQQVTVDPTTGQATLGGQPLSTLEEETPTTFSGLAAVLYSDFQQVAQDYLLYDPTNAQGSLLSTQDLVDDVNKALSQYTGTGSSGLVSQYAQDATDTFTQQAMKQASSVYPTLKPIIDQGTSPSTYIGPMTNYVANILGLSTSGPGSVNVMDPQWNWLISSPGANGTLAPVTQQQALQKITNPSFSWTNPNGQRMTYNNTNAAMQTGQSIVANLGQMFGVGGT